MLHLFVYLKSIKSIGQSEESILVIDLFVYLGQPLEALIAHAARDHQQGGEAGGEAELDVGHADPGELGGLTPLPHCHAVQAAQAQPRVVPGVSSVRQPGGKEQ